jgi:hypothetical protein
VTDIRNALLVTQGVALGLGYIAASRRFAYSFIYREHSSMAEYNHHYSITQNSREGLHLLLSVLQVLHLLDPEFLYSDSISQTV